MLVVAACNLGLSPTWKRLCLLDEGRKAFVPTTMQRDQCPDIAYIVAYMLTWKRDVLLSGGNDLCQEEFDQIKQAISTE